MSEIIYLAFQNSKLLGFAFDIDIFFGFLQGLYSQKADMKIEIQRVPIQNLQFNYQALYPMDEIIEFTKNVFITSKQSKYWTDYFEEYRLHAIEMIRKSGKGLQSLDHELLNLDNFLNYLGSDMIRGIVYGVSLEEVNTKYAMYMDYVRKIEDK